MLKVLPILAFNDNYIWALTIANSNTIYVVDPGDAKPVLNYLEQSNSKLAGILITHHHGDHTGGVKELLKNLKIPVYGPSLENIPYITHKLSENDEINLTELNNTKFKILDVPGHTSGHIAYYNDRYLFCGDTLFVAGCGRLFEGTPDQMLNSLNKLKNLPIDTKVYCAHEYTLANLKFAKHVEPENDDISNKIRLCENLRQNNIPTVPSTINSELKTNPFLRANIKSLQVNIAKLSKKNISSELDCFTQTRALKDIF